MTYDPKSIDFTDADVEAAVAALPLGTTREVRATLSYLASPRAVRAFTYVCEAVSADFALSLVGDGAEAVYTLTMDELREEALAALRYDQRWEHLRRTRASEQLLTT